MLVPLLLGGNFSEGRHGCWLSTLDRLVDPVVREAVVDLPQAYLPPQLSERR